MAADVVLHARGQHEGERERVRRLGGGRDPLGGVALVVQVAAGVPILDRASDGASSATRTIALAGALRSGAVAVLRSTETGRSVACVKPDTWETTSSSVTLPSSWPSVKAKPELVVASASESHGLENPGGPDVPRVGDHERWAFVQGSERRRPPHLGPHRCTSSTTLPRLPGVMTRSNAFTALASGNTESIAGRTASSSTRRASSTSCSRSGSTTK